MTIVIAKTNAELALAAEFERVAGKLPGGKAVAALRRKAFAVFAARGLPHRRIEEYKYTDLRVALKDALPLALLDDSNVASKDLNAALGPLAALDAHRVVLINGHFRAELSKLDAIPGVTIAPLAAALRTMPDDAGVRMLQSARPNGDSIVALNSAFATDGVLIEVTKDAKPGKPILIVHATAGREACHAVVRNVIAVRPGAMATIVEANVTLAGAAAGQLNAATDVAIGDEARVAHVKVTLGGGVHLASWAPTLCAGSTYRAFHLTAGAALVRNQIFVAFEGDGAKLDISGAMLGRGSEHIDTTLVIDHSTYGCESRELFKIVLDDTARGVFQGKVVVRRKAQKTDGKQMAQALMLSETAEFDSKPELEIYADDVACGHGSTSAEIDPAMMFYLRQRGIPKPEARALLIESFVGEAIAKVEHEAVRQALAGIAKQWLDRG